MAELPTIDELKNKALPTVNGLKRTPLDTSGDGVYSGQVADWHFTDSASGKILNDFGQGVAQGWGAASDWSKESDEALKKWGVYNDYSTGRTNLIKGLNELWMRPVIHGLAGAFGTAMGGFTGGAKGVVGALKDRSKALGDRGWLMGSAAELVGGAAEGAFGGAGEIITPFMGKTFAAARARAVIGEGERGYFNSAPVTAANLEARIEAGKKAGIEPAPVEPPILDPNFIARKMNPQLFNEWDRLIGIQENLRLSRDYLKNQLSGDFKADKKIKEKLAGIPGELQAIDEQLRDLGPKMTETRERADMSLDPTTKEGRAAIDWAQSEVLAAWFKRQDLEPEIQATLAQAESLVSSPRERLELEQARDKAAPKTEGESASKPPPSGPEKVLNDVKEVTGEQAAGVSPVINEAAESGVLRSTNTLKGVEGDGETKTRGLSASVEKSAVEKGLVDAFEEAPNYKTIGLADQADRAVKLITADYAKAKRIALGMEEAPDGLYPEAVFVAVEKEAIANGDIALLRLLATKSRLSEEATIMGQRTRLLGERNKDISPVSVIQDVAQSRKRTLETQKLLDQKDKIIEEGQAAIAKFEDDWNVFLDSIVCK